MINRLLMNYYATRYAAHQVGSTKELPKNSSQNFILQDEPRHANPSQYFVAQPSTALTSDNFVPAFAPDQQLPLPLPSKPIPPFLANSQVAPPEIALSLEYQIPASSPVHVQRVVTTEGTSPAILVESGASPNSLEAEFAVSARQQVNDSSLIIFPAAAGEAVSELDTLPATLPDLNEVNHVNIYNELGQPDFHCLLEHGGELLPQNLHNNPYRYQIKWHQHKYVFFKGIQDSQQYFFVSSAQISEGINDQQPEQAIGQGSFAVVGMHKNKYKTSTFKKLALKNDFPCDTRVMQQLWEDVHMMGLDLFLVPDIKNKRRHNIPRGGEILSNLSIAQVGADAIERLLVQMDKFHYTLNKQWAHGDIKPENLLVKDNLIQVIDFSYDANRVPSSKTPLYLPLLLTVEFVNGEGVLAQELFANPAFSILRDQFALLLSLVAVYQPRLFALRHTKVSNYQEALHYECEQARRNIKNQVAYKSAVAHTKRRMLKALLETSKSQLYKDSLKAALGLIPGICPTQLDHIVEFMVAMDTAPQRMPRLGYLHELLADFSPAERDSVKRGFISLR